MKTILVTCEGNKHIPAKAFEDNIAGLFDGYIRHPFSDYALIVPSHNVIIKIKRLK